MYICALISITDTITGCGSTLLVPYTCVRYNVYNNRVCVYNVHVCVHYYLY